MKEITDSEFVETEHVHDTYESQGTPKEFRPLVNTSSHKEATVATIFNAQFVGLSVALIDQELSAGNENIEAIMFLAKRASLVPFLTILATAANVGHRYNSPVVTGKDETGHT